jgi:hypothetical protein
LPYRLWILVTWFACLTLATLVGAKLTGSRAAGLLAALLWTISMNVVTPLVWASAYNQVLCAFFILLAFYARLRWLEIGEKKWIVLEWAAYILGFGAQEVMVMYPAIALLHALCINRKRVLSTLPLFIPAAAFTFIHFFVIPRSDGPYALAIDHRFPATLWNYVLWTIGPSRLGELVNHGRLPGIVATTLIGAGVAVFAIWKLRQRDLTVVFCCGWFLATLAPVLPLPDHLSDYYLTIPMLGFVWLFGWAIATAWRASEGLRVTAIVLTALYIASSFKEVDAALRWYHNRSIPVREVVLMMQDVERAHPGTAFLFEGIDNDLYHTVFTSNPFRIIGVEKIYFVPGGETGSEAKAEMQHPTNFASFLISAQDALALLDHGEARAYDLSSGHPREVSKIVQALLRDRL